MSYCLLLISSYPNFVLSKKIPKKLSCRDVCYLKKKKKSLSLCEIHLKFIYISIIKNFLLCTILVYTFVLLNNWKNYVFALTCVGCCWWLSFYISERSKHRPFFDFSLLLLMINRNLLVVTFACLCWWLLLAASSLFWFMCCVLGDLLKN